MAKLIENGVDYVRIYEFAKRNAKKRGIPHDLSRGEFESIVQRADGCCEITGIPFAGRHPTFSKNPWGPSIDRIESTHGYTLLNCRLVCIAVNIALNVWGLRIFQTIAVATCGRMGSNHKSTEEYFDDSDPEVITFEEMARQLRIPQKVMLEMLDRGMGPEARSVWRTFQMQGLVYTKASIREWLATGLAEIELRLCGATKKHMEAMRVPTWAELSGTNPFRAAPKRPSQVVTQFEI